jgi:hypothetical protein
MFGMAATGLPKGSGNALLVDRIVVPQHVVWRDSRCAGKQSDDVSASAALDTGIAALMRTLARRGLLPEPQ